ncbi:hypothetical protein NKH72_22495 [Mesorhizobium sp. M0955]|uniref:hypothetical protein n=1 Tax=Mesorhizobium sp. M0955 TaxID=2957033 RepID=UPI003339EE71
MTFHLTLDRTFRSQARHSVLYRSGYFAGLNNLAPNKWSMDQDMYVAGYTKGLFRRQINCAALIFATFGVAALLTLVACGL